MYDGKGLLFISRPGEYRAALRIAGAINTITGITGNGAYNWIGVAALYEQAETLMDLLIDGESIFDVICDYTAASLGKEKRISTEGLLEKLPDEANVFIRTNRFDPDAQHHKRKKVHIIGDFKLSFLDPEEFDRTVITGIEEAKRKHFWVNGQ